MKSTRLRLNPLAILALATLTWSSPATANPVNPTLSNYPAPNPNQDSIEIYVPPPERQETLFCSALLKPAIDSVIGNRQKHWGILVESLGDGTILYSHNANKYFIPASNTKLITTAAALQRLSPNSSIRSKSLKEWIAVTNTNSNNYYADTLLRHIGGAQAAKSALTKLGIDPNSYRLADGSGLSRRNAATPKVLVQLLRAMYYAPEKSVFHSSLPVAGVSGTLRRRMRKTPAQGIVYAKTGTLRGVRALSGYMNHPHYGILVFSILANDPGQSGTSLVGKIDKIVLQVSTSAPCQ